MNTGKSSKKSTKRPGTTSTGSKPRKKASKPKIVEFTPQQNRQKITFCIKGHVFDLSVPEVFVLNHIMLDTMQRGESMVALYTDFNKYQVGWIYGPVATNIEQVEINA